MTPATEQMDALRSAIEAYTFTDQRSVEDFKSQFSGKKGQIGELFSRLKEVPGPERAAYGQAVNALKEFAEQRLAEALLLLQSQRDSTAPPDVTLPGDPAWLGSRHPILVVQQRIVQVFQQLGFSVAEGPEIETDWYNFTALNFPPNHPARDMQDTYFIQHPTAGPHLLRTHTSSVQVREMEKRKPPMRLLMPGRVYRNEAVSARSHCFFHQVEGLAIEEKLSFRDLKQTLLFFARSIFGAETEIRLRPSYFPFTEISAEMDITCQICHGTGCNVCKHSGWVEVLGCGMVDPAVLANCGIDPERYNGFAFGIGIERTAMSMFRVPDLRLFSQNDVRFLRQFTAVL